MGVANNHQQKRRTSSIRYVDAFCEMPQLAMAQKSCTYDHCEIISEHVQVQVNSDDADFLETLLNGVDVRFLP